ncbi:MAG: hypothetical protein JXA99_09095 [Candidatus Lokiarchaeota archaeon]|nr:hypothetical protein [Candidatus Lokiarchaeota archaeon]
MSSFKALIVSINTDLLSSNYIGKIFSEELVIEFIQQGVDACGKNGEFHTVVIDGVIFQNLIDIIEGNRFFKNNYWVLDYKLKND